MSEQKFKIVILGDTCVGKSCILMRFVKNSMLHNHLSTIGIDRSTKTITTERGKATLQIWDTAGQDRFRSLSQSYIRNGDAIILVYDITSDVTFQHVTTWMDAIHNMAKQDVPIILVGNKTDMENERRITTEEGQKLAEKYKLLFKEVSAMTGDGVADAFTMLTIALFDKQGITGNGGCKLEDAKKSNRKKRCDC